MCCHCIVQQRIQLCQCKCTFCLACCTDGRFKTRFFRDDQFRFGQAEHIPDSPYHAGVAGHTAAEHHRFANRQPPHNGRLVVTDHCIAQSQQDIRRGNTFLLAVNDIRFGKHCAASGKPRDALRLLNQRRIILQLAAHTGHLILKKGTGTACAMLVGRKLRGPALDFRDEPRTLTADLNDRTDLRHKSAHTFHDGRNFSKLRQSRTAFQQCPGIITGHTNSKRLVPANSKFRQALPQVQKRPAVMHGKPVLLHRSVLHQHDLDRGGAKIHSQRIHWTAPFKNQPCCFEGLTFQTSFRIIELS